MSAWVSVPQQRLMTTWNNQTSTIPRRSEIVREARKWQELYTGLYLNCREFFHLEDFVGGIGIMLLKFRLLRSPDIFKTMPGEAKRGNLDVYMCAWLSRCGSFGIASVLQQFRATSTCCSLSFSFLGGTCVLEFLQPFFLLQTVGRSEPTDLVRRWTCGFHQIFASRVSSKTKMGRKFSRVSSWFLRWKNQIDSVRVHKWNITPQFALHVTTGGRCYLDVSTRCRGLMRFNNSFSLYLKK